MFILFFISSGESKLYSFENETDLQSWGYISTEETDSVTQNHALVLSPAQSASICVECDEGSSSHGIMFLWNNHGKYHNLFELNFSIDGKRKNLRDNDKSGWISTDNYLMPCGIQHNVTFNYETKDIWQDLPLGSSIPSCWIDNVSLIGLHIWGGEVTSKMSKVSPKNSLDEIIRILNGTGDSVVVEGHSNLQDIFNAIVQIQKNNPSYKKTLILESGEYHGKIMINNIRNISIKKAPSSDVTFSKGYDAICLVNASNITIDGVNIENGRFGVFMQDSVHCRILNNTIRSFSDSGVCLFNSSYNTIELNNINSQNTNSSGIRLIDSSNNTARENELSVESNLYLCENRSCNNTFVVETGCDNCAITCNGVVFWLSDNGFSKDDGVNKAIPFDPNSIIGACGSYSNIWELD
jgi:parallel beta-helix repeat protein